MKFQELLEAQQELNARLGCVPTNEQLSWALMAELGEFAQSRKGDWCWWSREGKEFSSESRDRQLDEIADILCFLLTGVLIDVESGRTGKSDPWFDANIKKIKMTVDPAIAASQFREVFEGIYPGFYKGAFLGFLRGCHRLGFTQTEIEAAYLKKIAVNKKRWEK